MGVMEEPKIPWGQSREEREMLEFIAEIIDRGTAPTEAESKKMRQLEERANKARKHWADTHVLIQKCGKMRWVPRK